MTENTKPRTWRRPNDHRHIELGMTVRDRLTGMEGIAASRVEYLTSCTQYAVSQPGLTSEGKAKPWDYFDWQRLEYAANVNNDWADVRTSEATRLANGAGEAPQRKLTMTPDQRKLTMTPDQIEQAAKANNLNAPRVSPADLEDNIVHTEIVKHVTYSGKVLRWAVLTCRNGFAVTGNPSASVSIENDHAPTDESVAIANAKSALWPLMGYALAEKEKEKEKENTAKGEEAPKSALLYQGFEKLAPFQQRVVLECEELSSKYAKLVSFLSQSPAPELSVDEIEDLRQQLGAMQEYLIVLRRRIGRF